MFLVNGLKDQALARLQALVTFHSEEEGAVTSRLRAFLERHLASGGLAPDLFLTGENGDHRITHFYTAGEAVIDDNIPVARFKHVCGEYPTAAAFGLWFACQLVGGLPLPGHMVKRTGTASANYKTIIFYNNYKGQQHRYMLLTAPSL